MAREYTNRLLELVELGVLDRDAVIMACVKYMSEADVQDMMEANEFILDGDEDEDEEGFSRDNDVWSAVEEEEEEWTPDNADYCDKGSRHHY